jgi:thioredoxin-like negative regulator of GroEL
MAPEDSLLVDADDCNDAWREANMLATEGRLDEAVNLLRSRADTADQYAAHQLADLLAEQGRVDELRARADTGNWYAATRLADFYTEQGRIDEAIATLRTRMSAKGPRAARDWLTW